MKRYIATFEGVWLGGFAYIEALDETRAMAKAQALIARNNLDQLGQSIQLTEITSDAHLIWDGDY